MVFLMLRQKIDTVQALLTVEEGKVSKRMVKWTSGLPDESIVLVEGLVEEPKEEVKSATVGGVEIKITQVMNYLICSYTCDLHQVKIHLISQPEIRLPFTLEDASRPESDFDDPEKQFNRVLIDTRLDNRILDLRVCTIFYTNIQSGLSIDIVDRHKSSCFQTSGEHNRLFQRISNF